MMLGRRRLGSLAAAAAIGLTALLALVALASSDPGGNSAQTPIPGAAGGPQAFGSGGNPVPFGKLQPRYTASDYTFETGVGPFTFSRFYAASADTWTVHPDGFTRAADLLRQTLHGEPFGQSPRPALDGGPSKAAAWWHSLYAFAQRYPGYCDNQVPVPECYFTTVVVRDTSGTYHEFSDPDDYWNNCAGQVGTPCWMMQAQTGSGARLETTQNGYVLHLPSGERQVFETPAPYTAYYLTRIEAPQFPGATGATRQKLALTYAPPDGCGETYDGVPDGGTVPGAPYVYEAANFVSLPGGGTTWVGTKLRFYYQLLPTSAPGLTGDECVLLKVDAHEHDSDGDLVTRTIARYDYAGNDAGLVAQASYPLDRELYGYGTVAQPLWRIDRLQDGGTAELMTLKTLADAGNGLLFGDIYGGYLLQDESPDEKWTVTVPGSSSTCPPGRLGYPCSYYQDQTFTSPSAGGGIFSGDGNRTAVQIQNRFRVELYNGPGTQTTVAGRQCLSGSSACAATGTSEQVTSWSTGYGTYGNRGVTLYESSPAGAFTVYGWGSNNATSDTELQTVSKGAVDYQGFGAVTSQHFDYTYGAIDAGYSQRLKTAWATTVVSGQSGDAGMRYLYDEFDRPLGEIRFGNTRTLDGTAVPRLVGTFYKYTYSGGGGGDSFGRVVETHGPCEASSLDDTDCASNSFPMTQFGYYAADAGTSNAGRLAWKRGYPNGGTDAGPVSGPTLETVYMTYDHRGNVLEENDVGRIVRRQFDAAGRLLKEGAGSASDPCNAECTETHYDADGRVDWKRGPAGTYELYCYRSGITPPSCSGGTLTSRVQWKGRSSSPSFSNLLERVEYQYANGRLLQETFKDSTGATRSIVKHEADPFGRSTFTGWGEGTGSYSSTSSFTNTDLVAAVGLPYNEPSAFCPFGAKRCATFVYDRVDRLISMTQYATPSATGNITCVKYDAEGNPSEIKTSQTPGTGCNGSDPAHTTTYEHDDFGNLISFSAPYMSGTTRFETDVRGNLIRKQTPAMGSDWVEFSYDFLNRPVAAAARTPSTTEQLWAHAYDDAGTPPSGCSAVNTNGRERVQTDSFGETWFSYDALGNLISADRVRAGHGGGCSSGTVNDHPRSSYTYADGGLLTSFTYPHGRVVRFVYDGGLPDRVSAIEMDLSPSGTRALVTGVQWEPYGGLRSYRAETSGGPAVVEYLREQNASSPPSSAGCGASKPNGSSDYTGRLRGLWVSSDGGTNGDLFRRVYTWKADQLTREDTCTLGQLSQTQSYATAAGGNGYDQLLQLTNVSRPTWEHQGDAGSGGTVGRRDYTYDTNGNRTSDIQDCWNFALNYANTDRLMSRASVGSWCGKPAGGYGVAYAYDDDGRATSRVFPADAGYTGQKRHVVELDWDLTDGGTSLSAATGSVFRWARVNGLGYEYFYDANGRRRLKDHPVGGTDEYFYAGTTIIEDRGVNDDFLPDGGHYPIDEYIWLDGRPVVMVRSKFSASWQREADVGGSTDCMRNGEPAACGVYYVVSDYLAKPVAMLDDSGKLAGIGDYDPYGHVNRVTLLGDTPHPYAPSSNTVLGNLRQPPLNTEVQVRPRLALLDTESPTAGYVYVADINDNAIGTANCGGAFDGGFAGGPCENWYTVPAGGVARIRFRATSNTSNAYQGAVLEGYEFRRYQPGAKTAWTPIRFPGQYHDAETDFFENWNRFYDPSVGRYVSPDPILMQPRNVIASALSGRGTPAYAYASNNPVVLIDPNGLRWTSYTNFAAIADVAETAILEGNYTMARQIASLGEDDTTRSLVVEPGCCFINNNEELSVGGDTTALSDGSVRTTIDPEYFKAVSDLLGYDSSTRELVAHELGEQVDVTAGVHDVAAKEFGATAAAHDGLRNPMPHDFSITEAQEHQIWDLVKGFLELQGKGGETPTKMQAPAAPKLPDTVK